MLRYYITGRRAAGGVEPAARPCRARPGKRRDLIQIREKDLSARELCALVRRVLALANPHGARILVNSRVDIAAGMRRSRGASAGGFPAPRAWRADRAGRLPRRRLHALARRPARCRRRGRRFRRLRAGLLYRFKGPVRPAAGPRCLAKAAAAVRIPVLALGGVTAENAPACLAAGPPVSPGFRCFSSEDRSF